MRLWFSEGRTILKVVGLLVCTACLQCSRGGKSNDSSPSTHTVETESCESVALEQLRERAVTDEDFARRIFYTWTTAAQGKALRRDRVLLFARADTGPGPTIFNRALMAIVRNRSLGQDVARLLLEREGLTTRRYAWPFPSATAVPRGSRSYGRVLVRVELRPEAWIGRFETNVQGSPMDFRDLAGQVVDPAAVRAHPERIAAIYHVRTRAQTPFREYVLCNESMVESWSLGTPEIAALVAEEQELLRSLLASSILDSVDRSSATEHWISLDPNASARQMWEASLAFDTPRHLPTAMNLRAMIDALGEHDPAGPALIHRPTVAFPPDRGPS